MTVTATTQTRQSAAASGSTGSIGALVALAAVLAGAVFLRLYAYNAFAWVPDQYERLIEARELLSGQMPDSVIYPPGATILLAPFVALLGPTEGAMQALTVFCGIALVPLAYAWAWRTTHDRLAAVLLAAACAMAPSVLIPARNGYVDSIVTLLIIAAFFLVPFLKGRGLYAFAGFGLLLALLFNIRPTSVFVAPPLVLYWLAESGTSWRPAPVFRALLSKELIVTALALAIPCGVSVLAGNWYGGGYGGLVAFDRFFHNLAQYWDWIVFTRLGLIFLSVPLLIGAVQLWRTRPSLALGILSFLALWPVAHSPFYFADGRYMAPAVVLALFLAALGFSKAIAGLAPMRALTRLWSVTALAALVALFGLSDGIMLVEADLRAAQSDAGMAAEMRPFLEDLAPNALVISAVTRAFHNDGIPGEYVDLFDQAVEFRGKAEGAADLRARANAVLSAGRPVYYLYSHMEADNRVFGGVWDRFQAYFDALDADFEMTEVQRTKHRRGGKEPWVLFKVSAPNPLENMAPPAAPVEEPGP
jgi:hypothetical protein